MSRERAQLQKIARLYYIEDLNQRRIADKLNISMASVSRGLARAKELGIVQISIADAPDSYQDLEVRIEQDFGIKECVVTPAFERPENTYRAYASALADLFPRIAPRNAIVGVSWGETLKALGEELTGTEALRCDVVPVIGAMGTIETGVYPNSIARTFAERLGGKSYLVNAPAVLDSAETAERILQDSAFEQVHDVWQRIDLAILGASSLTEETSMYRGGIFSTEELKMLRDAGAVAATNFIFLSRDGTVIAHPLSDRIVCLPEELMRRVPNVIVAAGGPGKAPAIAATLRSGMAHILITDADTAAELVDIPE
ncbi:MAG: sugar-binding transcriptional regulator [Alkalispirochaeta sp.]